MDLGRPRGLCHRPGWKIAWLPSCSVSGLPGWALFVPYRRLRCDQGSHKKKDMLSELAFSGRHAGASVWVLTQKFNAVGKDLREQTKWVALFHCKDRDSFEDCLRENDVIPTREERAAVRQLLAETKHAKLVLKTDQPAAYQVLCWA